MKSLDKLDIVESVKFGGYILSGILLETGLLIGTVGTLEKIAHKTNSACTPESKIIIGGIAIAGSIISFVCSKNYERISNYFNNRINKKIDKRDINYSC